MTDKRYMVEQGFECCQDGSYRIYSCAYCSFMKADRPQCLIVTGDLDAARAALDPPPALPTFHKVAGTCPACSGSTLMLGAGEHVTCSWIGCPDPMAARRRLAPLDDAAIERAALVIPSGPIGKYGDIEAVIADALSHHPANYVSGAHTERDVAGWIIAKVRKALVAAEENTDE